MKNVIPTNLQMARACRAPASLLFFRDEIRV
jgi:hypothetical protein